jgi:calcium/calmodulin-dependent protein kinase I
MEVLGEGCIGLVKAIVDIRTGEQFAVKKVTTNDEEIICNVIRSSPIRR